MLFGHSCFGGLDGLVVFFWSGCSCFQEFDLGWQWVGSSWTVLWFLSVTQVL